MADCLDPTNNRVGHNQVVEIPPTALTVNGKVVFKCKDGYKRTSGNGDSICIATNPNMSDWSDPTLVCEEITCINPAPANGSTNQAPPFSINQEATLTCNPGYRLVNSSGAALTQATFKVKCNNVGQWDPAVPTCVEIKCPAIPNIANGQVIGNQFGFGKEVKFKCSTGYKLTKTDGTALNENTFKVKCTGAGTWDHVLPVCSPKSCQDTIAATLTNGTVDKTAGLTVTSKILFKCNPGYKLNGSKEIECQPNTNWSGQAPTCDKMTECYNPTDQEFISMYPDVEGTLLENSVAIGKKIKFKCKYSADENESTCSEHGTSKDVYWDPSPPACPPQASNTPPVTPTKSKTVNPLVPPSKTIFTKTVMIIIASIVCVIGIVLAFIWRKQLL